MTGWLRKILQVDRSTGMRGERAAARHLKAQGYRILARNLRNKFGEVDLIATTPDDRTLVIVEVKAGEAGNGNLPPEWRVNKTKQRRLIALAAQIARQYKLTGKPIRFDVVGVDLPPGQPPRIRHLKAAFESHV